MGTCQCCNEASHERPGFSVYRRRSSGSRRPAWRGHHLGSHADAEGGLLIVALLFLFMLINFADKAVIGIAAVPIMQELKLSPSEFGLIGSSFFLLFALSAIVTGFVVNRVRTRWVLLAMGLVWALTQFPMMGAAGFGTLVACRIALGAGEGPTAPVALHSLTSGFPMSCAPCRPRSSCRAATAWRAAGHWYLSRHLRAELLAPYVMGSLIENAATPLDGFNVGFIICGIIMLVGGTIGMTLIRPEREAMQWASEMPEVAVGSA
jgi:MFS family permease